MDRCRGQHTQGRVVAIDGIKLSALNHHDPSNHQYSSRSSGCLLRVHRERARLILLGSKNFQGPLRILAGRLLTFLQSESSFAHGFKP